MRCEVVAVGTELLLGQIVDTNSSWIGEQLALAGIDSHFQTKVGDNLDRIVSALRLALERSDAVIVCGGLGPTQDDITREAIAEVMGVELVRDDEIVERIRPMFASRGGRWPTTTCARPTCPPGRRSSSSGGDGARAHLPGRRQGDLRRARRAPRDAGDAGAGGAPRPAGAGRRARGDRQPRAAHLGRGRVDAGRAGGAAARGARRRRQPDDRVPGQRHRGHQGAHHGEGADEERRRRRCSRPRRPSCARCWATLVFGVDDETMEDAVGALLEECGLTLGLAESVTGGLVASRIVDVPGSSGWFRARSWPTTAR